MCWMMLLMLTKAASTWAPSRSLMAGPPPLYGMCRPSVPLCCQNSSADRWSDEPLPEEAKLTLPGVFFRPAEQVGDRLVRRGGGHHQHVGRLHRDGDRVEVLQRVVLHALDQVRRDHERAERGHEQRVAVGGRALDEGGADGAGGARPCCR
jgi:hypothetical protein